ncbi:phosphatidylinositol 3-kinase regulatory subunit alpha-like [Panonychus citri]|uniref:phosphatidylinositol 3-kinase regulatory subunit alpha-like n=1 Tax=Panonychus citri TaxID=50023 RepID=UPI0023077C7A|nr:phosphatidylinositol 3-kinase regulatory subunit alpha-like [Panonychus citri]
MDSYQDLYHFCQSLKAINETIAILEAHIKLNETLKAESLPHEVEPMDNHHHILINLRDQMINKRQDIEFKLKTPVISSPTTSVPLTTTSTTTTTTTTTINSTDSCSYAVIDTTKGSTSNHGDEHLPHENESKWLVEDCDRAEAEKLLYKKPSGTFLIRKSRNGQFALSIMVDSKICHCLINKTPQGFGFAAPYYTHPTLKSLVLHYRQTSLQEHNEMLHTTLAFPVFSDSSDNIILE